jgi:hypothetical protein
MNENEDSHSQFIDISCKTYSYEYKSCQSFKSKLYQRYEGSNVDCNIFKDLINHCELWNKELNQNSLQSIVDYEKNLIIKRKHLSLNNDIWTYRDRPPYDWNSTLPEWASERIKNSIWFKLKNEDKKV